jgi:hypothetical protein
MRGLEMSHSDSVVGSPSSPATDETVALAGGANVVRAFNNMVSILASRQKLAFGNVCALDNRRFDVPLGFPR